jgi:hypothetical protein
MDKDPSKIAFVMRRTGCSEQTAIDYLDAEEWDEEDAVISLKGDEKANQDAVLAKHWQNMLRPSYRRAQQLIESEGYSL